MSFWADGMFNSPSYNHSVFKLLKNRLNSTSIELNHKAVPIAKKTSPSVAVKIEGPNQPILGRHWEQTDTLFSHISRRSIDTLKEHFREEVAKEDWALIVQMKKVFKID